MWRILIALPKLSMPQLLCSLAAELEFSADAFCKALVAPHCACMCKPQAGHCAYPSQVHAGKQNTWSWKAPRTGGEQEPLVSDGMISSGLPCPGWEGMDLSSSWKCL